MRRFAASMLVLFSIAAARAIAQPSPADPFVGRPIASLRLEVEGRATEDRVLLDLVETRVGAPLSMEEVRETLSHLFSLGRFQDIEVHAEPAPGGVAIRYNLIPLHGVSRIEFRGELGLDERQLRRAVTERFGVSPPIGRSDAAARALEQLYADRGYLRAEVTPAAEVQHDPDRTTLVFNVRSGPRARVAGVTVNGTPLVSSAALVGRLGLAPGRPYDPFALRRRIDDHVQEVRRRGYYEARIEQTFELRRDAGDAAGTGDLNVDVVLNVETGPRVEVTFEGDPLPKDRIADLVPLAREGSADQDLLEDSERRIERFLYQQGYWKAEASHEPVRRDGELTILFRVHRGPRYVVDGVEIAGNASVPIERLRPLVRTDRGNPFVAAALDADVAAVTEHYRQQGFRSVKVATEVNDVGEAPPAGVGRVAVRLLITEGPRTTVGAVRIEGHRAVSEAELRKVMSLAPGAPYYEPKVVADREAVLLAYLNRGYRSATVAVSVESGLSRTLPPEGLSRTLPNQQSADLVYRITEGAIVTVDQILIVGNQRTSDETIRNELLLRPGKPLGLSDLIESRRRLSALGLFRTVRIQPVAHGGTARSDLIVTVEEADRTTVGYGGGVEVGTRPFLSGGRAEERIELAPRGFFEIGRRNLGGTNRSVNFSTRVSFRPRGESLERPDESRFGFNEYRVVGTYREPRAFDWNVDTAVNAFFEQGIRTSFNFSRRGVYVDLLRRLTPALRLNARYSFGRVKLFDERIPPDDVLDVDRLFPQVRLSSGLASVFRDTRNDPLDPANGTFAGVDGEVAARAIGSQVGFAKMFVQGFTYRGLGGSRRIVVAGGARLGLATGFPRVVEGVRVRDLPASERFFAGGSTTVRGFALDKLGAPETISPQGFPLGGNALVVINAEVRAPLWRDFGGVAFFDAGNVFAKARDFDIDQVRSSAGVGLRYKSPIGPIRLDLGFKLRKRELAPGRFEGRTAFHISIGQAF
jgi:outer membrane protein assembly complex protein YaeT